MSRRAVDRWATEATAVAYSLSLGGGTLVLPLLAISTGYSQAEVGFLTAASAVAQIAVRLTLSAVMRRYPDRTLVTAAGLLLALSFVAIGLSSAVLPFLVAELLQGASRACFWTGLQTHVVRGDAVIVRSLARANLVANAGLLSGPVAAGFLVERSTGVALVAGGMAAATATVLSLGMRRLPPFLTGDLPLRSPLWRRREVAIACLSVGVAGSWRGLIGSYVPVVLEQEGQGPGAIGLLVAAANLSTTLSAALLARIPVRNPARVATVSFLGSAGATAVLGIVASVDVLAAGCLVAGGLGAGALHILGSARASEVVHEEERGEAIAVTGTFRAVALFASPAAVAGLLQVMALAPALAVVGTVLAAPAALARRWRR